VSRPGGNRDGAAVPGGSPEGDHVFPSTHWEWRRVKIRRPPEAQSTAAPQGRRLRGLPPRNPRESTFIQVHFRGGPECWYEVKARGRTLRYPGWVDLHSMMEEINQGDPYHRPD